MNNQSLLRRPFLYRYYNAAIIIIILNVAVFLLTNVLPGTSSIRISRYLSMNPVLVVKYHYWWQILTYMFVHADFSHILFNMLGLLFFGIQVERKIGSNEFLLFYLISGIGAGLFSLLVYWLSGSYLVFLMGASGAVFGVLLAFATLFPRAMIYIFGILPVRAPILVLGYTAIELFSQFFSVRSNVAHLTHLAGFGIAYLYLWIRLGLNPVRVFLEDRR